MNVTIYHNPSCATSCKTLAILEKSPGIVLTVVEYLKHPPTRTQLINIYRKANITARQGLRTTNSPAAQLCEQLNLLEATIGDDVILDAMMAHPALIQRPLVVSDFGACLCRPETLVVEALAQWQVKQQTGQAT